MSFLMRSTPTWLSMSLAIVLLGGCKTETPVRAPTVHPVMVTVVQSQATEHVRRLSASIAARDETHIAFRASGKVTARLVDTGQQVNAGQVLATLETQDYDLAVSAAADQLRAAQVDAKQQRADAERLARLMKDGSVGVADHDRQKARADAAQALQEQASRQLELAKNRVQYTTLVAPFAGVITHTQIEVGQVIAEGQSVMSIARTDVLDVVADIPEQLVGELSRWQAQASLWNDPNKRYAVRLRELSPIANPQTRTFTARFSGAPSTWKLGMTAQLFLQSGRNDHTAAVLPATALIQRNNHQPFVWKVTGNTVIAIPVQIVRYQQEQVFLQGLQDGDQIISAGAQKIDAAMQVRAIVRAAPMLSQAGVTPQGAQP